MLRLRRAATPMPSGREVDALRRMEAMSYTHARAKRALKFCEIKLADAARGAS